MTERVGELLRYDVVRTTTTATAFLGSVSRPTLVLGSRQPDRLVAPTVASTRVRRRRGGGGAVLLQPGDVWIDFWIPADDPRHRRDPRAAAIVVGGWWKEALQTRLAGPVTVHDGGSRNAEPAVVCFADLGAGELVVAERKVVGVTQWRVREGSLISTLLPTNDHQTLRDYLVVDREFNFDALGHHSLATLGWSDPAAITEDVLAAGGPWDRVDATVAP